MKKQLIIILSSIVVSACGSGGGGSPNSSIPVAINTTPDIPTQSVDKIKLNQVGFLPDDAKVAIVPSSEATTFLLVNVNDGSQVFSGQLSAPQTWQPSEEIVSVADFSSVTTSGEYRLKVEGFEDSNIVTINNDAFLAAHDAALKAYYFNRSSSTRWGLDKGIRSC